MEYGKGGHAQRSMVEGGISIHLNSTKPKEARFRTLFHELGHVLLGHLDDVNRFSYQVDRGTKEVEAELFSAYWSSFLGYEYRNELDAGAWMDEDVDLMKVFANVDRAVRKAEKILAE